LTADTRLRPGPPARVAPVIVAGGAEAAVVRFLHRRLRSRPPGSHISVAATDAGTARVAVHWLHDARH